MGLRSHDKTAFGKPLVYDRAVFIPEVHGVIGWPDGQAAGLSDASELHGKSSHIQ
jgi:hypothetical protein